MKLLALLVCITAWMCGCSTDAAVASRNLSKAAEMFEISRRVIFYNGITGEYMLLIEGLCSVDAEPGTNGEMLGVTCKVGPNQMKKHYLGLSDNVTYFVEHLEPTETNIYRYRVVFRPSTILPDIDTKIGL